LIELREEKRKEKKKTSYPECGTAIYKMEMYVSERMIESNKQTIFKNYNSELINLHFKILPKTITVL
jgi:hypothetical protein